MRNQSKLYWVAIMRDTTCSSIITRTRTKVKIVVVSPIAIAIAMTSQIVYAKDSLELISTNMTIIRIPQMLRLRNADVPV
jgi:hypothetical protein